MTTRAGHRPTELPIQPTPLIGRSDVVGEVIDLLGRDEVRLLTLSGPGGIGKTRIAIEVGEYLLDEFNGGVRLVLLAPLHDPALVLPTIARALNVREDAHLSSRDGLSQALEDADWLLILDSFEHLRAAAPEISWMLTTSDQLKVLITSRARLHIQGEHEYAVPPLAPPLPEAESDPLLEQNAAVQLFLQRARAVVPNFAFTPANGRAVAAICRKLEGLPLAIELAAARSKVLPPEAMLNQLDRRLPLLTGGALDVPERHRTMRDAIAWSYDLLSSDEQGFFRRLCVFSGGFSLLEAGSVALPPVDGPDVGEATLLSAIDRLAALVDNSLIRQQELEGEPRFVMLETIREFGLEELDRPGELDETRNRHAAYFVDFAEAALLRLRGAERSAWLERLEEAHDNLRSALTWLIQSGETGRATQLAGALWRFWWWRSHLAEGRQRLEQVLTMPGASDQGAFYARMLTGCGALAETQGDYAAAARYHEQAVAEWQALGDQRELALSLLFRWFVALNLDDQQQMTALSSECLRLFRELDDPWGVASSLLEQGVNAMVRNDFAAGEQITAEAIERFAAIGDPWGLGMSKGVLGNIKTGQGDYLSAMSYLQESLTVLLNLDDHWGVATVLLSIARTAAEQRQYEQVARISGAIESLHQTLGALLKVPFRERYERNLATAERLLGRERFAALLEEGRSMTMAGAVAASFAPPSATSDASASSNALDARTLSLSHREREVLRLVPGRTAKEIGETLFISESTVRTHIEHILNKLGLRNQKELIAYIYEHGLVG